MAKYRKKPVVIEAVQFHRLDPDNVNKIEAFVGKELHGNKNGTDAVEELIIQTLEGAMTAKLGDWIIKGVNGEFYPCKPDIFEKTYELVTD